MTQAHCTNCGRELNEDQKYCIDCGEQVKTPKPTVGRIDMTTASIAITFIVLFLFGIMLIVTFSANPKQPVNTSTTESQPTENQKVGEDEAYAWSNIYVEKRLKAPSTADFPPPSFADIVDLGDNRWQITSWVDAENSFGAKIRTNYRAVVRYDAENDEWSAESVDLDE